MVAEVGGVVFEDIIADECNRIGFKGFFSGGFSSESFLDIVEWFGLVFFKIPSDNFSI